MINPPTIAPGIEEKPPMINTGRAFNARSTKANWTPALAPHIIPATNATTPAAVQTRSIILFKGIPIELAAPGSSATALNPKPILVYLNKIDNPKIKYLDLKLGNICNLKCRICGTHSSSKWIAEQQHYDKEDKHEETHIRHSWPETNKEFWQQLEELLPTLEYIDFTGGEPFMIKDQFELLK